MNRKIFVVEDNPDLREIVVEFLENPNSGSYIVDSTESAVSALAKLSANDYDLLIFDWELPDGSGVELCTKYRAQGGTSPVLMLTGRGAIIDRESGLNAGADDYLVKPFEIEELGARVRALFRRSRAVVLSNVLEKGDLRFDLTAHEISKSGVPLVLLRREYLLLEFFMRHPGMIFDAYDLFSRVWDSESDASIDTVKSTILRLRQKIDTPGQDSYIETVRNAGYRFRGDLGAPN